MGSELPTGEGMEIDAQAFVKMGLTKFNSVVVPVLVIGPGLMQCVGTAFNISAGGLFVTARHVIDEALKFQGETPDSAIYVFWVGSGKGEDVPDLLGGRVRVIHYCKDDGNGSDLALLRAGMLRDGEPYAFPTVPLSARLPKVGTHILALGYARFKVESDVSNEQLRKILIEPNFHATTGEITQVFPGGRDTFRDEEGNFTGKLPTGCFETSARFDAGMSGGPVFDENFVVCGVIATGFDFGDEPVNSSFASGTPYIFLLGCLTVIE
jgi:hypothetical protein